MVVMAGEVRRTIGEAGGMPEMTDIAEMIEEVVAAVTTAVAEVAMAEIEIKMKRIIQNCSWEGYRAMRRKIKQEKFLVNSEK